MTTTPWNALREEATTVIDALPVPAEAKATFTAAMGALIDECERMLTQAERVQRWHQANAYTVLPDWRGLAAILGEDES